MSEATEDRTLSEDEGCGCGGDEDEGCGGGCGGHEDEGCGCGGGCGGHEDEGCGGGCGGCGGGCHHDQVGIFVVTPLQTNCYVYISDGECMVVDPGGSGAQLAQHLPEGLVVKYIAATHGHGDHVGGVKALKEATGASYLIHPLDAERAQHAGEANEMGISYDDNAPEPDQTYVEGDSFSVGTATFTVLETPGHTDGSVCLVGGQTASGVVFTGDTVFKGSCGRTDLAGGNARKMMESLARFKEVIPPHTNLFTGHGDYTTMEDELVSNPYFG